eukprot:TRINITY_DN73230_c0_g1_i1.p1 TRINITY_DN73230_c0_g1~~TRINITY_DN73230_c0_g1_i1.p1  ORF type:complete len:455 (+),score=27.20 TRINITY_DN73230_c0_g1_i1:74-1438(+)
MQLRAAPGLVKQESMPQLRLERRLVTCPAQSIETSRSCFALSLPIRERSVQSVRKVERSFSYAPRERQRCAPTASSPSTTHCTPRQPIMEHAPCTPTPRARSCTPRTATSPHTPALRFRDQVVPNIKRAENVAEGSTEKTCGQNGHSPSKKSAKKVTICLPAGSLTLRQTHLLPNQRLLRVAVFAPGAGTVQNRSVYGDMRRSGRFQVEELGRSRAEYDRYPHPWAQGVPAPNLESFTLDQLARNAFAHHDCLVFGSRGGQVGLPLVWQRLGTNTPPAVVINGGCAMALPVPVHWPQQAVTFLLLGGRDYFRGKATIENYIANAKSRVPAGNLTTAILHVNEMEHMPQTALLGLVLSPMIQTVFASKEIGSIVSSAFPDMLAALSQGAWTGLLSYKDQAGLWLDTPFGAAPSFPQTPRLASVTPILRQPRRLATWHPGMPAAVAVTRVAPCGGA